MYFAIQYMYIFWYTNRFHHQKNQTNSHTKKNQQSFVIVILCFIGRGNIISEDFFNERTYMRLSQTDLQELKETTPFDIWNKTDNAIFTPMLPLRHIRLN